MEQELRGLESDKKSRSQITRAPALPTQTPTKEKKQVIRKTRFDPSRKFEESIFFIEEKEIARYKHKEEDIYEFSGEIPDGKVGFINESKRTKGYEHYKGNKRHGRYVENYDNGRVKKEKRYFHGELRKVNEYFYDGQLRMKADYDDAIIYDVEEDVGEGAVYYRDGQLMYEWKVTIMGQERYKRSYNREGELVEEKTFDKYGQLINVVKH